MLNQGWKKDVTGFRATSPKQWPQAGNRKTPPCQWAVVECGTKHPFTLVTTTLRKQELGSGAFLSGVERRVREWEWKLCSDQRAGRLATSLPPPTDPLDK